MKIIRKSYKKAVKRDLHKRKAVILKEPPYEVGTIEGNERTQKKTLASSKTYLRKKGYTEAFYRDTNKTGGMRRISLKPKKRHDDSLF